MVCRWQTVEDGPPREHEPSTLHGVGTPQEFLRVVLPVRHPLSHQVMRRRLIIRASLVTQTVTAALEQVRVER